jgi:hypothetical protein
MIRLFQVLSHLRRRLGIAKRQLPAGLGAGDVCSVLSGGGDFCIAKVLVREPGVVHVRVYKEKFGWRPQRVDTSSLSLGTIHDQEGFGMGHLPLSEENFCGWLPMVICREPLDDEELEGYRAWSESRGGVWQ